MTDRTACLRCGGEMVNIGQERLQLGKFGFFLGDLDNLLSGALDVDIYCCRQCKKLEFYAIESPAKQNGGMAQTACPACGQLHDLDDPKCPHCGKRLF